ncbi:MAG: hypothetical protein V1856_03350 [Candidatus Liptonbacteria bacterium]
MNPEKRACPNCKQDFTIESEDFGYYQKMRVPSPTFCPDCRLQRRLAQRNERTLHHRKCDAPGHAENIISVYAPNKNLVVYDQDYWWSDNWDAAEYGQEYDFSKPFFEQYRELMARTPLIALFDSKSVDSQYCNITVGHKNCYLVSAGWDNEDSMYSNRISYCKNAVDCYVCHKLEYAYENVNCKDSYQLFYSRNSESCNNSWFLYDCRGCSDCICSTNLRNKQYYIFNRPHTKEEYQRKTAELNLGDRSTLEMLRAKLHELYSSSVHRYANIYRSVDVVGDNIEDSKNCHNCFDLPGDAENCKYCNWGTFGLKDSYDTGPGTGGKSELTYEGVSIGVNNADCAFGTIVWYSNDLRYGFNCHNCSHVFGCVSLRNKQYCILNKQYTKEEYESLLPRVMEHMNSTPYMDKQGIIYKFGEYFPVEISPFAYNDTVAQEYFPLSGETARAKGYSWSEKKEGSHATTLSADELPGNISGVGDEVLNETIECAHKGECAHQCPGAYRITPGELAFYRKFNIPLPQMCFNCRHYARLEQRNPMKLWDRQCSCLAAGLKNPSYHNKSEHFHGDKPCPNAFRTPFAPERPEIVYCENCYNHEIA